MPRSVKAVIKHNHQGCANASTIEHGLCGVCSLSIFRKRFGLQSLPLSPGSGPPDSAIGGTAIGTEAWSSRSGSSGAAGAGAKTGAKSCRVALGTPRARRSRARSAAHLFFFCCIGARHRARRRSYRAPRGEAVRSIRLRGFWRPLRPGVSPSGGGPSWTGTAELSRL
jgi:hypothetical protein